MSTPPVHAAPDEPPRRGALHEERPRVVISTDLGGHDPDDIQSLVHYLVYADLFDTEGIISSPPGPGRVADIHGVLDAYAADLPDLRRFSGRYPDAHDLRAVTQQGATDPAPPAGVSQPSAGSRWLIERAQAPDHRPLWILVWGSLTDVAQALHDAPAIKPRLRVYSIGSWNTAQDPAARHYVWNEHPDLWWLESDTTFRGMYIGGDHTGDLANDRFIEHHINRRGHLGTYLEAAKPDIKMGDTPSVLYLLRGEAANPERPSWGGRFIRPDPARPTYWHDDPDPHFRAGSHNGAAHVNQWRVQFLRHWQDRMLRLPLQRR